MSGLPSQLFVFDYNVPALQQPLGGGTFHALRPCVVISRDQAEHCAVGANLSTWKAKQAHAKFKAGIGCRANPASKTNRTRTRLPGANVLHP